MGRQQDRVLRAMIAHREFTVEDLCNYSGVSAPTIRTVINRFQDCLDSIGSVATGRPGGQLSRYRLKPEAIRKLIDKVLDFTTVDGPLIDAERRKLLDLSTAHSTLLSLFSRAPGRREQMQLLDLVNQDLGVAKQHLSSFHRDDTDFAKYAQRIEEVSALYNERVALVDTERELDQLRNAIAGALAEVVDQPNEIQEPAEHGSSEREPGTLVIVDATPSSWSWTSVLCRDLDRATVQSQIIDCHDQAALFNVSLNNEFISGCIMALDSSVVEADKILPTIQYLNLVPKLIPILVVDAEQNTNLKQSVSDWHWFYTTRSFVGDAQGVLQFYSQIIQSIRVAHGLVTSKAIYQAPADGRPLVLTRPHHREM